MIEYRVENKGIIFYLPAYNNLPFDKWEEVIKKKYLPRYISLSELIQNGTAEQVDSHIKVNPIDLYNQSDSRINMIGDLEYSFLVLGLPTLYKGSIFIENGETLLHQKGFRFQVSFCKKVGIHGCIEKKYYKRRLNILYYNEEPIYTLNYIQFKILETIDSFNNLPEEENTFEKNILRLAELKKIIKSIENSNIHFCDYLEKENIYSPESLSIDISLDKETDELEIIPQIAGEDTKNAQLINEGFIKTFDRRLKVDSVYNIQNNNGDRIRIPLAQNQRTELSKIKNGLRKISDPEIKKRIIEHPEEYFDPDITDLSVFYSNRVIDIGVYKPKIYPFVCPYKSEWIPGFIIEDRINGQTRIHFKDRIEFLSFDNAVVKAEKDGKKEVIWRDLLIPIEEAEIIRTAAQNQFSSQDLPGGSNEKKVLIIKENAELLEYEDDHSLSSIEHMYDNIEKLNLKKQLKKHQIEGVAWMQSLWRNNAPGCLLADDMGLGKTIQVLSFLEWLAYNKEACNILTVVPVALLENWKEEYASYFIKGLYETIILNDQLSIDLCFKEVQKNIRERSVLYLVGYETLRKYQLKLCSLNWDVIVLDEAQRIKTPGRMITNAAKALKARFKIAMTGTPVENTYHDLWSIMDFCVPGLMGSAKDFAKEYRTDKAKDESELIDTGDKIRNKIGVYMKRRLKGDILHDLPRKYLSSNIEDSAVFKDLELTAFMPAVQEKTYMQALEELKSERTYFSNVKSSSILVTIQRLKLISDHPTLIYDNLPQTSVSEIISSSARLKILTSLLDFIKLRNEKVIIFAEYRRSQQIIAMVVKENYNFLPAIINGDTPVSEESSGRYCKSRQKTISEFNLSKGFNIIIMSPLAAGVGLNVTGANHVIHYSRHWNPAKEEQATDRAYRIGQTRDVLVYYPISKIKNIKTFDEILKELLDRKRKLASAALFPSEIAEIKQTDILKEIMN